ncbi:MAG TPA: hypothetical protein VJZ71_10600 [Phycisphaerae bacterium]|nr:hypothetical protein [Phycisphaerae bacterium]
MIERWAIQPVGDRARAFTIVELIVSMGILTATMIAVATVFSISSDAAGRTEAHAEVLEASAAFQQTVADELSRIVPDGLLIIESPPPTLVRAEVSEGPRVFRLRHDRLVFISSKGTEGAYQSFTDPTRARPDLTDAETRRTPASSPEALIYYGPGIPVAGNGTAAGIRTPFDDPAILTASEWMFAHRAILLMVEDPGVAGWVPATKADFDAGLLMPNTTGMFEARMDAIVTGMNPVAALGNWLDVVWTNLAAPPVQLSDLWQPNLTPITTSLVDPADADYFTRSGFTFQPRMVDFRIEWTDGGSVDLLGPDDLPGTGDEDLRTRWFGLVPDRDELPDLNSLNSMRYLAQMRGRPGATNHANPNPSNIDNPNPSPGIWDSIEWSQSGITADPGAHYRAVWRRGTWQFRPKALRFTYRIYDATRRLKQPTSVDFDEDGTADPDPANPTSPFIVTRYGQEFSIVVPVP